MIIRLLRSTLSCKAWHSGLDGLGSSLSLDGIRCLTTQWNQEHGINTISSTCDATTAEKYQIGEYNRPAEKVKENVLSGLTYVDLIAQSSNGDSRQPKAKFSCTEHDSIHNILSCMTRSAHAREVALHEGINEDVFERSAHRFVVLVQKKLETVDSHALCELTAHQIVTSLLPTFLEYTRHQFRYEIQEYKRILHARDLSEPHLWFPMARSIQRKIVYHAGPTNSGKTYNALLAMKNAPSGVYCGPLRLLAMEVYESCNLEGTHCSLVTGQEKREVPGASHTSCTVEMINLNKRVDVAVIDEIQVIGDESRGWAWTRALLGVPASEIHVCGDGSAVDLVRWLAGQVNDPFEVRTYDRFTPLEVEENGLQDGYKSVQPGDCIVAFSRNDIFSIKSFIEKETPYKACVVYGALPPETRRQQAKQFNDPNSGFDIMVASDAVGMGLNLNIRRVIFHKMEKREGSRELKPVSTSMAKQIAGRAGRRSSQYAKGTATCLDRSDVKRLRDSLAVPLEKLATPKAGLFPEFEHFEAFAAGHDYDSFSSLLREFSAQAVLHGRYFFCRHESTLALAELLEEVDGLSLHDLYSFCMAPASTTDLRISAAMLHFAKMYAAGLPCELELIPGDVPPTTVESMRDYEAAHQVATLWLWLANRFADGSFVNKEGALQVSDTICKLLEEGLGLLTKSPLVNSTTDATSKRNWEPPAKDRTYDITATKRKKGSVTNKTGKVCKTSRQLFQPYRTEFFLLFNRMKENVEEK